MAGRTNQIKQISFLALVALLAAGCGSLRSNDTNSSLEPTRTPAPVATISTLKEATPESKPTKSAGASPATVAPKVADAKPAAPTCTDVKPNLAALKPSNNTATGRIVYLTPDGNVALTDATGRDNVNVTTDGFVDQAKQEARIYQFPTFSNDGKALAFVSASAVGGGFTQTVHVASVSAKPKLIDLYSTHEINIPYLDWSPDNQTIAFLTIGQGEGQIRTVSKSGGTVSVLDSGSSAYWHWRNDSSAIIAHLGGVYSPNGGDAHIAVIDAIKNNGEQSKLTRIEALPGRFQSPHYSPDGKFMLFVLSVGSEVDDLMLADATGALICTITRMQAGAFFAWSPNGTQIAYLDTVSPLQQPGPLTILDLVTGKRTSIERNAMVFFWSPDGSKLALYSLAKDTQPTQLGVSTPKLAAPAQQTGSVTLRIEMIDAKTGNAIKVADTLPTRDFLQFFPFFDQYSRAVTPWSPDSKSLVFVTSDSAAAKTDIAVATLNPAKNSITLKRIASGSLAFWSPQ